MQTPPDITGLKALVVDDHDPMRKSLKKVVSNMGFGDVFECSDGESALQILDQKPIDLVITDLYMHKVSGLDLLATIRSRNMASDIPVIIVTGETGKSDIVQAADKGAEDYLIKPFQAADLEKKIQKALDNYFSPTPLLRHLRIAEKYFVSEFWDRAKSGFEAALKIEPESARAWHGLALSHWKIGDWDSAIKNLKKCLQFNPQFYKAHRSLADIYFSRGMMKEGLTALITELQLNPKQIDRQIKAAHLFLKAGRPKDAVRHYRAALAEDPKIIPALMGMGHAFAQEGNLNKALYYFRRVRRYQPHATKALEAGIKACLAHKDWKKAELFLKDEKTAHPAQMDTYLLLSTLFSMQNRPQDNLILADEMLLRQPGQKEALLIKAKAQVQLENNAEALPIYEELAKTTPSWEVYSEIAKLHFKDLRLVEAETAALQALSFLEHGWDPYEILADIKRGSREWMEASILYLKAVAAGASSEDLTNKLNECQQKRHMRRQRHPLTKVAS